MYSIEQLSSAEQVPDYLNTTVELALLAEREQFEAIGQMSDKGAVGENELGLHYISILRMEKAPELITAIHKKLQSGVETDVMLANKIADLKTRLKTTIRARYEDPKEADKRIAELEQNA